MRHALGRWASLKRRLAGAGLFIFLDYDGTLSPVAETPGEASTPAETRRLLEALAKKPRCKVAVISGRSVQDVKKKVGIGGVIYSGNHGLELEGPGFRFQSPLTKGYRAALRSIKAELLKKLFRVKGVILEDKGLSLSLHYRLVDKNDVPRVKAAFHKAVTLYVARGRIKAGLGKMVLEVRPPLDWDKGKAVLWLLGRQKFGDVLPVYLGDDLTDEDAFRALKGKGLTICVGPPRRLSRAEYYLSGTPEVTEFLRRLTALRS